MKNTYMFYEGVVSPEICESIIERFDKEQFSSGQVGSGGQGGRVDTNIRDTAIQWAPKNDLVECILTRFIMQANQEALWNFDITEPEQVQIGRYKENQFYKQHIDCYIKGGDIIATGNGGGIVIPMLSQRKISASLLLNDESDYEGGDLIVLDETVPTKKQGTIIVFPSFMAHHVTPVTRGVRYSAVCWMAGPKWK
jgi:PKHD-type hydroxylase